MDAAAGYGLVDFGSGAKLERFGSRTIHRESPSVGMSRPKRTASQWRADLKFAAEAWTGTGAEDAWDCQLSGIRFELRPTPTGQVGVFPEQKFNWDWIKANGSLVEGKRAINLFGYTGGTTLALASQGAELVHVDSARSVVSWARRNAANNTLEDKPIRWIVDDAMGFVDRELRRGNTYDIFVADPPSFGRGVKKETWKFDRDFEKLMNMARELCPSPLMVLLSGHTPGWSGADLQQAICSMFDIDEFNVESGALVLKCEDGRELRSGHFARFCRGR